MKEYARELYLYFYPNADGLMIESSDYAVRHCQDCRGKFGGDESVVRQTPQAIRDAARRAKREGCSGYVPSLEVFNYVQTEPEEGVDYQVGKRLKPYGFGWLADGEIPYRELSIRVNRIAYRAYANDPDLSDEAFRTLLGKELFGSSAPAQAMTQATEDALFLQRAFAEGRTWCQGALVASPARVKALRGANKLTVAELADCRAKLKLVREIEGRYRGGAAEFAEMERIAKWVLGQWGGEDQGSGGGCEDD